MTITLTDGVTTISLQGEKGARVEYNLSPRIPQIGIPNRTGDILQSLGRESVEIRISGFILPDATWNTNLGQLASWAAVGTPITFAFAMMPSPFTNLIGKLADLAPSVRIGEKDFVVINLKFVEG